MQITFSKKKFEKLANDYEKSKKDLGPQRAKLLQRRLGDLTNAVTLEDVRHLPGHYHELTGDRKGQWSCDLDQPYRLIFTPHEHPVPTNDEGVSVWSEIFGVEVIEIVDYHK